MLAVVMTVAAELESADHPDLAHVARAYRRAADLVAQLDEPPRRGRPPGLRGRRAQARAARREGGLGPPAGSASNDASLAVVYGAVRGP